MRWGGGEGGGAAGKQGALPPIVDEAAPRELGTITVRKPQFGFIKCCERPGDLFFHVSAVEGMQGGEQLKVGDDVEFAVGRDPHTKKTIAVRLTRVPKGSAVFEVVSDEQYTGVVLERAVAGKNYTKVTSGVLEYEWGGSKHKIIYGVPDLHDARCNPSVGDRVTFRIATSLRAAKAARQAGAAASQHAGRRATQVVPLRHTGRVAALKDRFGFIRRPRAAAVSVAEADKVDRWGHTEPLAAPTAAPAEEAAAAPAPDTALPPGKEDGQAAEVEGSPASDSTGGAQGDKEEDKGSRDVFFHLTEVEDGVQLRIGDEVDFMMWDNPKTGEVNARRVRRTREAPTGAPAAQGHGAQHKGGHHHGHQAHAGGHEGGAGDTPGPPAERRKLLLTPPSFLSAAKAAMYVPKGPDGSKGFTMGRGRPLQAHAGAGRPAMGAMSPRNAGLGASVHLASPKLPPLPPLQSRLSSSPQVAGLVPTTTMLMGLVHDAQGRPSLMRVTSSGRLDPNAPVFIPRTMSTASIATEASFVSCDSDFMSSNSGRLLSSPVPQDV